MHIARRNRSYAVAGGPERLSSESDSEAGAMVRLAGVSRSAYK